MKYDIVYFEQATAKELTADMQAWFYDNPGISLRDVAFLTEMRVSQLNPRMPQVVYIGIVTFRI